MKRRGSGHELFVVITEAVVQHASFPARSPSPSSLYILVSDGLEDRISAPLVSALFFESVASSLSSSYLTARCL